MDCDQCGVPLEPRSKFCLKCGAALEQDEQAATEIAHDIPPTSGPETTAITASAKGPELSTNVDTRAISSPYKRGFAGWWQQHSRAQQRSIAAVPVILIVMLTVVIGIKRGDHNQANAKQPLTVGQGRVIPEHIAPTATIAGLRWHNFPLPGDRLVSRTDVNGQGLVTFYMPQSYNNTLYELLSLGQRAGFGCFITYPDQLQGKPAYLQLWQDDRPHYLLMIALTPVEYQPNETYVTITSLPQEAATMLESHQLAVQPCGP